MKAICTSACEIRGIGIVGAGEEVELPDGFYNDARIRAHFAVEEKTVKDRNAKPPDLMAEADARRERFAQHLCNHTEQIKALNALMDFGADIPRDLVDPGRDDAQTESERIAKIVELWCDNFGYAFPTDPQPNKKQDAAKKPAKKKGGKPQQDDGEAGARGDAETPGGDRGEDESGGEEGDKDGAKAGDQPGGDAGAAQQSLFDKLNGKT